MSLFLLLLYAQVGEVGEVAECFQWKGEAENGLPGKIRFVVILV